MPKPEKKRVRNPINTSISIRTVAKDDLMAAHDLHVRKHGKTSFFDFMDLHARVIRREYENNNY